jgi:hypothetical protein
VDWKWLSTWSRIQDDLHIFIVSISLWVTVVIEVVECVDVPLASFFIWTSAGERVCTLHDRCSETVPCNTSMLMLPYDCYMAVPLSTVHLFLYKYNAVVTTVSLQISDCCHLLNVIAPFSTIFMQYLQSCSICRLQTMVTIRRINSTLFFSRKYDLLSSPISD